MEQRDADTVEPTPKFKILNSLFLQTFEVEFQFTKQNS